VLVEKWNGPQAEESASTIAAGVVSVELRVTGEDQDCTFAFATEPGHWIGLGGKADASVLSTQTGGGFVGAMVGLHARLEP
jgi:alpha-N-arabinofuranosidase